MKYSQRSTSGTRSKLRNLPTSSPPCWCLILRSGPRLWTVYSTNGWPLTHSCLCLLSVTACATINRFIFILNVPEIVHEDLFKLAIAQDNIKTKYSDFLGLVTGLHVSIFPEDIKSNVACPQVLLHP